MRRFAATSFVAVLVGAAAAIAVPSPAGAVVVCTGPGVLVTGSPIYHHVIVTGTGVRVTAPVTTTFAASPVIGACVDSTPLSDGLLPAPVTLTGIKSGWCGQSTGTGTTNRGHRFAWVEVGSKMVFTGEMAGIVTGYVPDVLAGQSCVTGATRFLMGWSVFAEWPCFTKSKTSGTVPIPSTATTLPLVDVQTGPQAYWLKLCVPDPIS